MFLDFYVTRFDIKLPDFFVFGDTSLSLNQIVSAVCTFFLMWKTNLVTVITVLPIQNRFQDNLILCITPHCNNAAAKA